MQHVHKSRKDVHKSEVDLRLKNYRLCNTFHNVQGIVADSEGNGPSSKERFVLKYVEATSMLTDEDRLQVASDASQFNALVSTRANIIQLNG